MNQIKMKYIKMLTIDLKKTSLINFSRYFEIKIIHINTEINNVVKINLHENLICLISIKQ